MPIPLLLLAAADAQKNGQWTAFRRWAAEDVVMFDPQPVQAQAWLKDRKDPPKAIEWWPTASYVSCAGKLAVNTGGWRRSDGSVGYFTTIWRQQTDGGWKWIMDGGDKLKVARPTPATPERVRASCHGKAAIDVGGNVVFSDDTNDVYPAADRTLNAGWTIQRDGSRTFFTAIWTGRKFTRVIDDLIAAPTP